MTVSMPKSLGRVPSIAYGLNSGCFGGLGFGRFGRLWRFVEYGIDQPGLLRLTGNYIVVIASRIAQHKYAKRERYYEQYQYYHELCRDSAPSAAACFHA